MAKWLENAIFYEIYPQSFNDTNGDGIGDFQGIIEKLDYIKETGFNAIWMNPCFDSPFGDAGYDVRDYKKAAARYGTNDDLKRLFDECHKRGMHILLDLVPGHTSVEHEWFKKSMLPESNEYTDRYIWTSNIWEQPEGLNCIRGISDRDGSAAVNFFSSQPALNYGYAEPKYAYQQKPTDPGPMATRAAIKDVMKFWLDMGCDGFRVDMAGSLVKCDPEYKETIKLWQDITGYLKSEYPEAAMVSEWGEPQYSLQGGFDMDFLLHFGPEGYNSMFRSVEPFFSKRGKGTPAIFAEQYNGYHEKATTGGGLICIPSGNHDMDRLARGRDEDELKCCFAFLLTMPGAPFVYYGDEIGMNFVEGLVSVEGGYNRTGSRSPMQWDSTANDGFSTADKSQLYIKQDDAPDRPTVEKQMLDEKSLYNEIKKLIKLRNENSALHNLSAFEFVSSDGYPLVYKRSSDNQTVYVFINPSDKAVTVNADYAKGGKAIYTLGENGSVKADTVTVPASGAIFVEV